jgi:hypothetical protein
MPAMDARLESCVRPRVGRVSVNVVATVKSALALVLPPRGSRLNARLRRVRSRLWFFMLLFAVCLIYRFIGSAGAEQWPVYGVYHDLQADGFLGGHASLPIQPAPELLHAKNPYDYANVRYWWLDASYYRGKYYIYWGPVPALLQAAGKWVLGIRGSVGDQYVDVFFHDLAFVAGALLIERLLHRLFNARSPWLLTLAVLVFAFANPTPHGVATASTYHTAILAAQAWLYCGFLFAFDAVWHAASGSARSWRLVLAGTCWGLALGSRVTVLPAILLLVSFTAAAEAWPAARRFRRLLSSGLAVGSPVALAGIALLAFNKLRFDAWLEFGSKLQLSAFPIRFSPSYLLANLYSYTFRPAVVTCEFPYVHQVWSMGAPAFPRGFPLPPDYLVLEPIVGWALAVPFTWLIPFAFALAPRPAQLSSPRVRCYLFCLCSFVVLSSVSGAVALLVYTGTMRYLSDVTFGLTLLGVLGGFALRFHRIGLAAPRAVSWLLALLGLATVSVGLALGYQGYNLHFKTYNPSLHRRLVSALSLCGSRPPEARPKSGP